MHESRIEEGDALIEAPIVANSTDADVLADIAHYAFDKFIDERDDDSGAAMRQLKRSIEYGSRAVDRNPTDLEALYYFGLANEADGDLKRAADMLLMGLAIDAAVPRLNSALARVLLKGGQPQAASFLISRLYSANHSEEGRARLRSILRQIEDGTLDLDELDHLL